MAENEKDYWEKKATDEEALARLQENLEALDAARANYEKEREQSMRYYDKQRDDQLFAEMIEKAKLDTKPITPELRRELESDYGQWLDEQRRTLENYKASDGTKEIASGTMSTFDKKAAEIVEKGNVHTSVPFLNEARQLAAEKYAAFEDKQAAYGLEIERMTAEGDVTAAKVLEARKEYEAAAYERDTAQSVLAKYEVLYGADSRNYREQAADVEKLTAQADDLYAKLEAVTEMDDHLKETLQSETLMLEHLPAADDAAQRDDEIVIENPEIEMTEADQVEKSRQEEEERLRRLEVVDGKEETAQAEVPKVDPVEEQHQQQEADREDMETLMQDLGSDPETEDVDDEEALRWAEDSLQAEQPSKDERSPMMDRVRERIEETKENEAFEAGWQEFTSGEDDPSTTEADDAEARADAILRDMDEGRDPYADGYDDFEARQAAAEDELERQAYGDPEPESDSDGEAQMAEDRHFTEMPIEVDVPEDHDREYEMAPVHRYEDDDDRKAQFPTEVSTASLTQEFSETDRQRLDHMESRVDEAMERLAAAKESGDAEGISDARQALAAANTDFKDYLSDRQDFKANLAEVKNDAERLVNTDPEDRSSAARDFGESYSKASQSIDKMEQEGKPWADDMRRDLQDTAQRYHEQDVDQRGDVDSSRHPTVASTAQDAERAGDEDRVVVAAPTASVMASYQVQTDEERERQR